MGPKQMGDGGIEGVTDGGAVRLCGVYHTHLDRDQGVRLDLEISAESPAADGHVQRDAVDAQPLPRRPGPGLLCICMYVCIYIHTLSIHIQVYV